MIFAIVSACSLYFRHLEPDLGLRPRYTAANYNDADDASEWWRRLYDVTANCSQSWNISIL